MIKEYNFSVSGLATYYRVRWYVGYVGNIEHSFNDVIATVNNEVFARTKIPVHWYSNFDNRINEEAYNRYSNNTTDWLMGDKIINMLSELGFSPKARYRGNNTSLPVSPTDYNIDTNSSSIRFTHPLFGEQMTLDWLCFSDSHGWMYQARGEGQNISIITGMYATDLVNECKQQFKLMNANTTIATVTINKEANSGFDLNTRFKILKNDKTEEWILLQASDKESSDDLDILMGCFLVNGTKNFYMPGTNNGIYTLNGEFNKAVSLGLNAGFFNSYPLSTTNSGIILPCYLTVYGTNNILLNAPCQSLKKATGNFKLHSEYVIDNELYYCIYCKNYQAILFDEGMAVSK